ncbi:MAG: DUF3788 domain-containing protein [Salinivirgaceae bacterium]|jgi:hypothetical protein|nr:DUF3788 domain-containing protein [Salinivirgaceae bacterium]
MDSSVFMEKEQIPTQKELSKKLTDKIKWWQQIRDFVFEKYPKAVEEWNFPGKKYGWSFRIKDKKRVIIYLLPREGSFMVAFVFGQKAYTQIMETEIDESIKTELTNARVYAEGRGIRIAVDSESVIEDIERLVEIKLAY